MKEIGPVSIRINEDEKNEISQIGSKLGDGPSVASGIRALLKFYRDNKPSDNQEEEFKLVEIEISRLKSSPFGFDKKEISLLEKELEKAKEKYKKLKSESIKERLLKLVNSAS